MHIDALIHTFRLLDILDIFVVAIGIYYEGVEIIILPSSQMDQKFMSTIRVNKLVSRSKS